MVFQIERESFFEATDLFFIYLYLFFKHVLKMSLCSFGFFNSSCFLAFSSPFL